MKQPSHYYNPEEDLTITHGHLPHWNQQQKRYAVTFRLYDALPRHVLHSYLVEWDETYGKVAPEVRPERVTWLHERMMEHLDAGYGVCWLRDGAVRRIVESAFCHVNTRVARILAYVIMPNHVHAVLETRPGVTIQYVMHSLKGFSAHRINQYLGRTGRVWQREYFDRVVRSDTHFQRAIQYIMSNPRHCKMGEFTLWIPDM